MNTDIEKLTLSDAKLPKVLLHPIAVFSILNSFMRRSDKNSRSIGTLLGVVTEDTIEVTDCFGFSHLESTVDGKISVTLDVQMSQAMFSFHRRINKKEQIVGWYATTTKDGLYISEYSSLIHEFYHSQCKNPIHVVIDTTLQSDLMHARAFMSKPMLVDGHILGNVFDEIKLDMHFSNGELTCLHHMLNNQVNNSSANSTDATITASVIPSEKENVQTSIEKLTTLLDEIQIYVDKVVDNKTPQSAEIGVALYDSLSRLESYKKTDLASLVQDKSQDMAMLSYLTTLAETQVQIAEKLNSVL